MAILARTMTLPRGEVDLDRQKDRTKGLIDGWVRSRMYASESPNLLPR